LINNYSDAIAAAWVEELVKEYGLDVNQISNNGETALCYMAMLKRRACAIKMLELGADVRIIASQAFV
jgi:hypothetical protein